VGVPINLRRHDPQQRRKPRRSGREKGVWVFIPAADLEKAGIDPSGPAPEYRTWGSARGSVLVRLYRKGT
jgi:hypothetical protein